MAVRLSGWAQNERAPVCGGNGLNACCDEGTYHPYGQNRDPDCQLCIHLYHCLAPCSWGFCFSCSGRPSQVTLVMQAGYQTRRIGPPRADPRIPPKPGQISFFDQGPPDLCPGRARQTKQKRYYVTFMLGGGGSRRGPVYSLRHGRFGRTGCRCHGRGAAGSRKRAP